MNKTNLLSDSFLPNSIIISAIILFCSGLPISYAQQPGAVQLPKLEDVQPVEVPGLGGPKGEGFFHSPFATLEYRVSDTSDRTRVTKVSEQGYGLAAGLHVGKRARFQLSTFFSEQDVDSQPLLFPIDLKSDNETEDYMLSVDYSFMPGVYVSGFYGQGEGKGTYTFLSLFPVDGASSSDTDRYGVSTTITLPTRGVLTELSATYLHTESDQTYPPGNDPLTDSFEADVYSIGVSSVLPLSNKVNLAGNLNYVHIGSQKIAQGNLEIDRNWFTTGAGLSYELDIKTRVTFSHQRWISNQTTSFRTTSVQLNRYF